MIFLLFLPIIVSALTYNDPCQNKCDLPGLVCENSRCQCDSTKRLFWTGARCLACPNSWSRSDTACIVYYHTPMTWEAARSTCRGQKAELISFRRPDIVQLLYTLQKRVNRKKRTPQYTDAMGGWTSARDQDPQNDIYTWLDPLVPSFNSQSSLWCRKDMKLGYLYKYDEPTRLTSKDSPEVEACVVYWRGAKNSPYVCLDDQLCSRTYEFVCELSESTAKQHVGPAPTPAETGTNNLAVVQPIGNNNNNPNPNGAATKEPEKSSKTLIIIIGVVAAALILLGLLVGFYCCWKKPQNEANVRSSKATVPISQASDVSSIAPPTIAEPVKKPEPTRIPEPPTPAVIPQKAKNQRGGFTKQQFDEFD